MLNPGFEAIEGAQVHLHTNETTHSRIQSPEESIGNPQYNRKAETNNECKSIYE